MVGLQGMDEALNMGKSLLQAVLLLQLVERLFLRRGVRTTLQGISRQGGLSSKLLMQAMLQKGLWIGDRYQGGDWLARELQMETAWQAQMAPQELR